ncbi:uncharacterized protein C11orf16 homolog, partial [Melanotaenia boesemani]|uniref:uncharacterized protein C11orf16 homolog n=1 Tax=Melanotaenia boesemani TaxID=1250792 RepID=UPI001C03F3E5
MDGFYYQGTLLHQAEVVCSLDMVNDSRAQTHALVPGDVVLSPWEPDLKRYGPGRVMTATVCRVDYVTNLRVLMWNGCAPLVPYSMVWPISAYQYDRLVRELHAPSSASSRCCSWLSTHKSAVPPQLSFTNCSQSASASCCSPETNNLPCVVSPCCRSILRELERFARTGQHRQVDLGNTDSRKSDSEAPSSPSSSPSVDEA